MHFIGYFFLACGLAAGNYVYQHMLDTPDWMKAHERSFFQVVAILVCYIMNKVWSRKEVSDEG